MKNIQNYVETVLQPKLQGDGGWIECLILERCVAWIEEQIKKDLNKTVKVVAIRKKPYFQDV